MFKTVSEKIEISHAIDDQIKKLQEKQQLLKHSTVTVRWGDLVDEIEKLSGVKKESFEPSIGCYHIVYSSGHTTENILDEVKQRVEDGSNGPIKISFNLSDYKNFKFAITTTVDPYKDQSNLKKHIALEPIKNNYGPVTAISLVPSNDLLIDIPFSALLENTEKCHPVELLQKAVENCEKKLSAEQNKEESAEMV